MEAPWWKRLLSYLTEIHVETQYSAFNENIYVLLKNGRYMLCTDEAIYSYEDRYSNFGAAFDRLDLNRFPLRNCLLLGFGLGSIPILLEKRGVEDVHFTGVEVDESVIYLASKYGIPKISSPISLIQADAELFVQQCTESFDMITVDLFIDDIVPAPFLTPEFLENCSELIRGEGLLLFNRLALTDHDKQESDEYFESVFRTVYPEATFIQYHGNRILLNHGRFIKPQ